MKVLLYRDSVGACKLWQNHFAEILDHNGIEYRWVKFDNMFKRPKSPEKFMRELRKVYEPGDYFVCRFNRERHEALIPVYKQISDLVGDDHMFPNYNSFWYYDDKVKQMETYQKNGYNCPAQAWVKDAEELNGFMKKEGLSFPLVRKDPGGAASTCVSLIESENTEYPCLVQDFWSNNDSDLKVNIIGPYAMTYKRYVRENDFRASGSGKDEYPEDVPREVMELAYQISKDHGFDCMGYDFIKDHNGDWGVIEMSYTTTNEYVHQTQYYYDCEDDYRKMNKEGLLAEYFILKNLVPGIERQ
ncbi:hypothetical protein JD969_06745 [Planctomycetota bacterium]|nr:hypothetical protein JD969_06745 [Planctomycetota bacterium]